MAKKSTKKTITQASSGKLAGKTVAFVGKFGSGNYQTQNHKRTIARAGGTVVDHNRKLPDYVWLGEGRNGKLPSDVAKIQAKKPDVEVLDTAAFQAMLMPDKATVI